MTRDTTKRRRSTLSTVRKSQATMLAAWVRRNSRQLGPDPRGAGPSPARASSRRTVDGDNRKPSLASSPPIRRWSQRGFSRASGHEGPHVGRRGRVSALAGRLPPLPAHERPMPAQQRPRADHTRSAPGAWQLAGRRREQGPISGAKPRPRDLAGQHLKLVAQDQQLDVLGVQATATRNECAQQGPEREVEEGEGHYRRSSQAAREGRDTSIGALQGRTPRAPGSHDAAAGATAASTHGRYQTNGMSR